MMLAVVYRESNQSNIWKPALEYTQYLPKWAEPLSL